MFISRGPLRSPARVRVNGAITTRLRVMYGPRIKGVMSFLVVIWFSGRCHSSFFVPRSSQNLPHNASMGAPFYLCDCLRVHVHRDLEIGVTKRFLNRLDILAVGLHQGPE